MCFECLLFKVTEPNSIPYRTHPACAKSHELTSGKLRIGKRLLLAVPAGDPAGYDWDLADGLSGSNKKALCLDEPEWHHVCEKLLKRGSCNPCPKHPSGTLSSFRARVQLRRECSSLSLPPRGPSGLQKTNTKYTLAPLPLSLTHTSKPLRATHMQQKIFFENQSTPTASQARATVTKRRPPT